MTSANRAIHELRIVAIAHMQLLGEFVELNPDVPVWAERLEEAKEVLELTKDFKPSMEELKQWESERRIERKW